MVTAEIALDFDDVCTHTIQSKDNYYQEKLGCSPESHPDYQTVRREFYSDIEYSLQNLRLHNGVIEAIDALQTSGYGIRIVTNRSESSLIVAQKILERDNLNHIPIYGVGYGNSKLAFVKGCIAFVDDDPKNFSDMFGVVPNLYLMNTIENTSHCDPRLLRISNLEEMLTHLLREG